MDIRRKKSGIVLNWLAALAWTGVVAVLMLLPGEDTVAEDTSRFFGGTALTDSIGHVIMYAVLVGFWWNALRHGRSGLQALRWAVTLALILGVMTESGQSFVPDRGANVLDLLANVLGASLAAAALLVARRFRRRFSF